MGTDAHSVGVPSQHELGGVHTQELPRSPSAACVHWALVFKRLQAMIVALSGENPHPEQAMLVPMALEAVGAGGGARWALFAMLGAVLAIRSASSNMGTPERGIPWDMSSACCGLAACTIMVTFGSVCSGRSAVRWADIELSQQLNTQRYVHWDVLQQYQAILIADSVFQQHTLVASDL